MGARTEPWLAGFGADRRAPVPIRVRVGGVQTVRGCVSKEHKSTAAEWIQVGL